jgi:AraC family transcriptional regulator
VVFWESNLKQTIPPATSGYRDRWLALLDQHGVGHPKALHVQDVPGGLVQATIGEPPGRIALDGAPTNVLMFNMSPVQALRQTREGRSFVSDMLHGEMTLMPCGVPSQWSWNSSCDRLDVAISPNVFGDESKLEVVDSFRFRDSEMESICGRLYREISLRGADERLYMESLVMDLAVSLLHRHSTASQARTILPSSGLTRIQARRVLDYVESNLSRDLTLDELARIVDLSLHHFARMFKKTIGVAPYRYILARRVEHAKGMLRATSATLVEVGLSAGFCSQSHFTSTFRRMVGATPAEFKRFKRSRSPS